MGFRLFIREARHTFRVLRVASPDYFKKVTLVDKILKVTVLWMIPKWLTPNHFTILRFLSIPFLIFLLLSEQYHGLNMLFFAFAAFSDAIDGALARTRNQITKWGILNDPLADKLLIGSVVAIMVSRYISSTLAFIIMGLELFILVSALYKTRHGGKIIPAKWVGKIKMILESFGLVFIFVFAISKEAMFLSIGTNLLYTAIFFALLSIFVYKSV